MGIETLLLAAGVSASTASTAGTIAAVAGGISAIGSVVGGVQQARAAGEQSKLAQQEAETRARAEARQNIELEKRQKLGFISGGVALEGSPLLVLAETKRLGAENVGAIVETGQTQAESLKSTGRQALIGGLTTGAATAGGLGTPL